MIVTIMRAVLALAFVTLFTVISVHGAAIPEITLNILSSDWSDASIDSMIDITGASNSYRELSAPLGDGAQCSEMRTLRLYESLIAGVCVRCLHLEFLPSADDRHNLSAVVLDYKISHKRQVSDLLSTLFTSTGFRESPPTVTDLTIGRTVEWSRTWTVTDEMRSLNVSITKSREAWQIHFDHRRWRVHGLRSDP